MFRLRFRSVSPRLRWTVHPSPLAPRLHIDHRQLHAHQGAGKFNFGTFAGFLTSFGGAGYILINWGGIGLVVVLMLGVLSGLAGAFLIFLFAAKVLAPTDLWTPRTTGWKVSSAPSPAPSSPGRRVK